jgi:hypothetical protein
MAAAGRYELLSKQWMKHNSAKPLAKNSCTYTLPRSMENNTVDSPWWACATLCYDTPNITTTIRHQTKTNQHFSANAKGVAVNQ